jgi:hypothetical protein
MPGSAFFLSSKKFWKAFLALVEATIIASTPRVSIWSISCCSSEAFSSDDEMTSPYPRSRRKREMPVVNSAKEGVNWVQNDQSYAKRLSGDRGSSSQVGPIIQLLHAAQHAIARRLADIRVISRKL